MDTENSLYEIMFILKPDLGEQKTQEKIKEVKDLIASLDGEITFEDVWGLRDFAYTIKKYDSGYYVVLNFSMPPRRVVEMDKPLILDQLVIRYLITKTPKGYAPMSLNAYQQQWDKEEKEEKAKQDEDDKRKTSRKPAVRKEEPKEVKTEVKPVAKPVEEKVVKVKEPKEEVVAAPKEESKKEVVVEEVAEKPQGAAERLKEVDEKLKNIINDPDISL